MSKDRTGRGKSQRMTPSPRQQPEGRLNPFATVRHGPITAPSVVAFGQGGPRTAYVLPPIILLHQPEELDGAEGRGRAPRRAVVLDEATPPGEGEYCELTRRLGGQPVSMRADAGGAVINPLDPRITAAAGRAGQVRVAEEGLS